MNLTRHISDEGLCSIYRTCRWIEANGTPWQVEAAALTRILLATGARIGELCGKRGLLIEDCNPPLFRIRVGKTNAAARMVKVMPEAQTFFEALVKERTRKGETRLFNFCERTGLRYWSWVLEQAGVDHRGTHGARRNFITWEVSTGRLNPLQTLGQVGHKKLDTTAAHYYEGLAEYAWVENPEINWRREAALTA